MFVFFKLKKFKHALMKNTSDRYHPLCKKLIFVI